MIALLMALQATTVHCSPDYLGGVTCTVNTPQTALPVVPDYYSRAVSQASDARRIVGQMLTSGNCAGALSYALKSGDPALAQAVKSYCR